MATGAAACIIRQAGHSGLRCDAANHSWRGADGMRLIDAEPQLVVDMLEEMAVSDSRDGNSYTVYIGQHPTLGRMVVVKGPHGAGHVVELD